MSGVTPKRWSQEITETSNALDLERGVFTLDSPREIAESLKRSAERSTRRKSVPFRSAMSMLNFYINRAGRGLPPEAEGGPRKGQGRAAGALSPTDPSREGGLKSPRGNR